MKQQASLQTYSHKCSGIILTPHLSQNFENNVDNLDLQKANKIIADYFPKNNFQMVLQRKSKDIKKIAIKYGKLTDVNIK